jgi:hypothetical protein
MKLFSIFIPSAKKQELKGAIETYVVRWTCRVGGYHGDTRVRYQAFTNMDEAKKFKKSLEDAHALIGNTSGNVVTIEKQSHGLNAE